MNGYFEPLRRKIGAVTLCVTVLIAEIAVAQVPAISKSSPKQTSAWLQLVDPKPKDWEQIHDHEAVKILEIVDIRKEGSRVNDRSIEALSQFKNLKTLVIFCDQLTDDAIPHLLKLKHLLPAWLLLSRPRAPKSPEKQGV